MKKFAAIWLICAIILAAGGCGSRDRAAASPEPTATATLLPETPAPSPTATPEPTPEPTPTPTPMPSAPPTVQWTRGEEPAQYTLLVGRGEGAKALGDWLRGPGAALAAAYVPEGLDAPVYTLRFAPTEGEAEIPDATEETAQLRIAADAAILDGGLLSALLPEFEGQYGYTVEVYSGEGALSGGVNAALLTDAAAAGVAGEFNAVVAYLTAEYVPAQ